MIALLLKEYISRNIDKRASRVQVANEITAFCNSIYTSTILL